MKKIRNEIVENDIVLVWISRKYLVNPNYLNTQFSSYRFFFSIQHNNVFSDIIIKKGNLLTHLRFILSFPFEIPDFFVFTQTWNKIIY